MTKNKKINGSITALITPFKNDAVDENAFAKLVEWQIKAGSHGLVPCGTTGESPTLSHAEHEQVIEICISVAAGKIPVVAGTGSNSTREAIHMTQHAEKAGADAVLSMVPYYNKPMQEGLYQHFKAIHDASSLPIILYNIPGRSVVDMKDETIARLAALPRIVGIKDATGDLKRPASLQKALRGIKDDFILLSGEDGTAMEFNERGGVGCISVASNIAPELCAAMQSAWLKGDKKTALSIQEKLAKLSEVLFIETSPAPVKYASHLMGFCAPDLRLPMVEVREENKQKIRQVLESMQLL